MYCSDLILIKQARTKHRCDWCGEEIKIGESYNKWMYADGGEAETVKAHPECLEASYQSDPDETYFNMDHKRGVADE